MVVKYSTTAVNNTIKTNSIVLGNGTGDYGPPGSGFWSGITPPASGYTIYTLTAGRPEPSIVVANNDTEAIYFAKSFGGTGISTIAQALAYLTTGSTGTTIVNIDYPDITTNGSVLHLDPAFVPSYPRMGNSWKDLSGNARHGTLIASPTYDTAVSGNLKFNGSSQYSTIPNFNYGRTGCTISAFVNFWQSNLAGWKTGIVNKWQTGGNNFNEFCLSSGNLAGNSPGNPTFYVQLSNLNIVGLIDTGTTMTVGVWYNLVGTFDGSYLRVYCNGILKRTSELTLSNTIQIIASQPLSIASFGTSVGLYPGFQQIGVVSIYNRPLSDDEILQYFNTLKGRYGL